MVLTKSACASSRSFVSLRFGSRSTVLKCPIGYSMFAEQVPLTVWLGGEEWLTLRTRVRLLTCEIKAQNLKWEMKHYWLRSIESKYNITYYNIILNTSNCSMFDHSFCITVRIIRDLLICNGWRTLPAKWLTNEIETTKYTIFLRMVFSSLYCRIV